MGNCACDNQGVLNNVQNNNDDIQGNQTTQRSIQPQNKQNQNRYAIFNEDQLSTNFEYNDFRSLEQKSQHEPPSEIAKVYLNDIQVHNPKIKKVMSYLDELQNERLSKLSVFLPQSYQYLDSKDIYRGQWWNGKRQGKGELYFYDGRVYQGNFENDQIQGFGRIIYTNGDNYIGYFQNGVFQGKGNIKFENGDIFQGDFLNGLKHGKGTLIQQQGNYKYEGEFINNLKWGQGKESVINEYIYEGQFQNDKKQGEGVCKWQNGKIYEGEWFEDQIHGWGQLVWADGKIYTGQFVQSKFEGYGEFSWPQGILYKGDWKKGNINGKGQFFDQDENVIQGSFVDGKLIINFNKEQKKNQNFNNNSLVYDQQTNQSMYKNSQINVQDFKVFDDLAISNNFITSRQDTLIQNTNLQPQSQANSSQKTNQNTTKKI